MTAVLEALVTAILETIVTAVLEAIVTSVLEAIVTARHSLPLRMLSSGYAIYKNLQMYLQRYTVN